MITTLTGPNSFALRQKLDELASKFVKEYGDLALEKIDAEEASYEQIIGAVEAMPFLASKKMVVVYRLSANKQASESLEKILERAAESTDLIIVEPKLDKRGTYYKQLKKLTDFQEFGELDELGLAKWLEGEANKRGATLPRAESMYLVRRANTNQLGLLNELIKLIDFSSLITKENIDLLVDESPSSTVFNMLDSVFSGNIKQALKIYDEQRKLRVEPQVLHAMLVWQMHAVALVATAPKEVAVPEIAKESGINPFVLRKSQGIARKMGRDGVEKFLKLLRDIDYKSKRTTLDYDEAMRFALMSLAK